MNSPTLSSDPGFAQGFVVFLLLGALGALAMTFTRRHRDTLGFQLRLFLLGYFLRFALSVAVYQFGLVSVFGDEDSWGWVSGAGIQAAWLHRGESFLSLPMLWLEAFDPSQGHHAGYFYLTATLFFITDSPVRLVAAALNCFAGALTIVFAYRIARTLFSDWVACRVAWWTCLFPSMLIWSALTVKEPIVILLETAALYGCVRVREVGLSARHILLCAVTIVLLLPFRFYAAYLVGAAVVLSLAAPALFQPRRGLAGALVLAVAAALIAGTGSFARHESDFDSFSLERVGQFRKDVATSGYKEAKGSGVLTDYDMTTPGGFTMGTAVGAAHLLLAPFPWQLRAGSLRMLLSLPEVVYWWVLVFLGLIPGAFYTFRYRRSEVAVLFLFIAGFGLLYSMMFGNVGLVMRQRAQLLPWLFIFAAVGLEQRALRRAARREAAGSPSWEAPERSDRAGGRYGTAPAMRATEEGVP